MCRYDADRWGGVRGWRWVEHAVCYAGDAERHQGGGAETDLPDAYGLGIACHEGGLPSLAQLSIASNL